MTASSGRKPKRSSPRIRSVAMAVRKPPANSGIPNSRLETEGRAQEFRQVGRHGHQFHQHPHGHDHRAREMLAAMFGQIHARGDAELGGQCLDQHRHQIAGDDDPEQQYSRIGRRPGYWLRNCPDPYKRRWR